MCRRAAISAIGTLVSATILAAQAPGTNDAWFGIVVPARSAEAHRAVVSVTGVTPAAAVVPGGEERRTELAGQAIRTHLERVVSFSKPNEGERFWGRVTGFPAALAVTNWVAEQFRTAGLSDVQVQEYDGTGEFWWARSWEARLLPDPRFGGATAPAVLESALPTSGSRIAGSDITAPLVFVGDVSSPVAASLDVAGRVAVQHLKPASGAYSERGRTSTRARELTTKGALAVINVVEQTGNMQVRDFGNCGGPCFNVGAADGAFLEAAIQKAAQAGLANDLRIRLTLQAETLTGLKGHNALGVIRGASDENIIVNAHADGWFDAAGDNGDGVAVLIALARHFSKPENRPARTLLFVASGGHHSPGLNGPANLVRMNKALTSKTVLVVNLEHVAQLEIRPSPWRAEANEQPMSFGISNQSPFLIALARQAKERYQFRINEPFGAGVPGDLGGYEPLGVARVQAIHSGPMYHTSGDTLDTISVPGLERAARFFAHLISEAAKAPATDINPR